MKRKAPPTPGRTYKRRRLSSPTKTAENAENDETEIISPMTDITNTADKISPRPAQLITKQLESKRILLATQKKINLTDDEENIIYEENEENEQDFNDENETEIGRGTKKRNINKNINQDIDDIDIDLDEDPFNIPDFDPFHTKNTNQQTVNDQFQTIPEESLIDSENEAPPQRVSISASRMGTKQRKKRKALREITETDDDMTEIEEIESDYDVMMNEELEISQTLLSQRRDIEIQDIPNNDDNQSMNMSLQIEIEKNVNDMLLNKKDNDDDSMISNIFKDANISTIESPKSSHSMDIPSPSPVILDRNDKIERSMELEEDEKAIELLSDENIIIPTKESQQRILSQTVSESNNMENEETVIQIEQISKSRTYSNRKHRKKRKEMIQIREDKEERDIAVINTEKERNDFLTPISRDLVERLNKSLLAPTTRSRRRHSKKGRDREKIQILPQEVDIEYEVEMEEERRKKRKKRMRMERVEKVGRTYSLLDELRKKQMMEGEEGEDMDDMEDVDILNNEDEMRQMILNQSGLSQQWDLIEKQRKKKRRETRRKLAGYTKKKKRKKRKKKTDADFVGVRRPKMSEAVAEEYKQKEDELASFWRDIESKMNNDELEQDVVVLDERNEREINIAGRRALTPPRIAKHLERRYRKEYENMTGDLVEISRRKKGKRVWFCKEKKDVLNEIQQEKWEEEMNNSLISVTPPSASPIPTEQEQEEQEEEEQEQEQEEEVQAFEDMVIPMDDVSLHSLPAISGMDESSVLRVVADGESLSDVRKESDDSLLRGNFVSVGISVTMPEKEQTEEEIESVVSGHLLPSIGDLSSIMEGDDEEELMDEQGIDDPFAIQSDVMDVDIEQNETGEI